MPKLLASVQLDIHEPLPIDVLRFGIIHKDKSPQDFVDQVAMLAWPRGVREYVAETLDDEVSTDGTNVLDLFEQYNQIAVYSVNPWNADLINRLIELYPQEKLSIICSDDEIDRHWKYQCLIRSEPNRSSERDAELREKLLYPPSVEKAFEGMRRWLIGRTPWEEMLRTGRRAPIEILPHIPPILNRIPGLQDVERSESVYRIVLFPKPSVGKDHFLEAARKIVQENKTLALEIVSFRNDMPTLSLIDAGTRPVWLRCYPYPIYEDMYHRIIAASHGLVIVPRGGLSTIRDAVRYGLDLISIFPNTANELAVTADIGLLLSPLEKLEIQGIDSQQRRNFNRTALARYEFSSITAFRNIYCTT
ncbi:hypothetical protein [Paucibacter sp. KCTC 42545]|uniref:hypothetical protein n=1 Tax=Paucibacter sp. KCTC 42545 TaxID=1768242 RepID=UPI0012E35E28|nr:hypothetical protein [Paucibacter sp. KCTC 42545]